MGIRFLTAGESHGPCITSIIDGIPRGLEISAGQINEELKRRQEGYGRGGRMRIEKDQVSILSGVRNGCTTGAPITLHIENKDYKNWKEVMSVENTAQAELVTRPRPGHADLPGMLKFGLSDARDVMERASARETASRVAIGAIAKILIGKIGIRVMGRVLQIGNTSAEISSDDISSFEKARKSPVFCPSEAASDSMVSEIDRAREEGDTLGGIFEVGAFGVIPGLGSYSQWDLRLDARLTFALMSIPAVKGVEIGSGFGLASLKGSEAHDEIYPGRKGIIRKTNRAGGIEGGITNGETIILRAAMKPIPTLRKPLMTVDTEKMERALAHKERADICAVPSACIIGEAVVALTLADAALEKFGGDSIDEFMRNYEGYLKQIGKFWRRSKH